MVFNDWTRVGHVISVQLEFLCRNLESRRKGRVTMTTQQQKIRRELKYVNVETMGSYVSPASTYSTTWLLKHRWEIKGDYYFVYHQFSQVCFQHFLRTVWLVLWRGGNIVWDKPKPWQGNAVQWSRAQTLDWNIWIQVPLTSCMTLVKKSSVIFLIYKRGIETVLTSSVPLWGENEITTMLSE